MTTFAMSGVAAVPLTVDDEVQSNNKKRRNALVHQIHDELLEIDSNRGKNDTSREGRRSADLESIFVLKDGDLFATVTSVSKGAGTTLRPDLEATPGFEPTACGDWGCDGYLNLSQLESIESLPSVHGIRPSRMFTSSATSSSRMLSIPDTERFEGSGAYPGSVKALQIEKIHEVYPHLTGTGMKICVVSDSFRTSATARPSYDTDIKTGDIPDGVYVVQDGENEFSSPTDEGRAMLQLVSVSKLI